MGRPEPCVLFSQTFVHSQLDEYVDEVIFAEPVVIAACEFLEQNASSTSPVVTLMGATSPPSFALEVFVQCEGETRFRRLCQPFLYSHSSSNVLEVEAVVTNHLVVRGSYRSLSLVIYGNTAEDLGQFNIEVDLDSSLTGTVFSIEGKLEDLPPALHPTNLTIEDLISAPKALSLEVGVSDISFEIKQLLGLAFKILQLPNLGDAINKVVSSVVSVASSCATHSYSPAVCQKQSLLERSRTCEGQLPYVITEARKLLVDTYNSLQYQSGDPSAESLSDSPFLESEDDLMNPKQLMDFLTKYFPFDRTSGDPTDPQLPKDKSVILWLSAALLFCSGRESCFHFVNSGGMEQLEYILCRNMHNSRAITLMLLGVVEQATRHSIGCEGFLGWWPREDESVPSSTSEGYNQLLKLLLQRQSHDIALLATHILHRLRFYEVASRYESAVLSVLESISADGNVSSFTLGKLTSAKSHLKTLMKLISSRGPIEDPSQLARASRSLLLGETEGVLSYKATNSLITSSNCWFSNWDIDSHLLSLLKERGFFPLSAALLSSSVLRAQTGHAIDTFVDIASHLEAITLSLLFCRSGLIFLLLHPELSATIILALKGADCQKKEEPIQLHYASVLISKGFFCHLEEIGMIVETHLRVVNAIDCLLASDPHAEEILWVLWELCVISRTHCGRQALLALGHFPEAISILIAALHSAKELDSVTSNSGHPPLNLAVFHSAAEIFEVIVTDLTASSLGSWIGNAPELHKALHSCSPGSNRKDAPTRLLEWIDACIVYHRKGAIGLLQYVAVLASGGDAHIASTSILSSDTIDAENIVGDSSTSSDANVVENLLGKPISENSYRATVLRDSSVAQLTTAFRILAFISENSAVAAALYDEGAVVVIHAVLINCTLMLERSSNNYDYLVDEGTESNSTSDLLMERNREQSLVDLLIPSLVLLITLLQRLQEAKEQHRNTKLMKALLQLHREMSPRLAACAAELSSPYPGSALGFEAVCHLLVSALSCWPVYGWTPGLFSFLVDSLHATSLLALGPKEACSLLCLLNDLFPEEGFWLWKNGMPMLSALRTLAIGTLLGPHKEKQISWYLQPEHGEKLLSQFTPQVDKIAQIILHCAVSTLVVLQDMLRVFVIRIACLNAHLACILLRPIILFIGDRISESSSLSDTDAYKVYRLLDFLATLLEHPRAKPLLFKEGAVKMLIKVLEKCISVADTDGKQFSDNRLISNCGFPQLTWCVPAFKCFSLICDSQTSMQYVGMQDRHDSENLTAGDCSQILSYLLKLGKVLPVGRELHACLSTFKEFCSSSEGQTALLSIFMHAQSSRTEEYDSDGRHETDGNLFNALEWRKSPPLLCCWITLLRSLDSKDVIPDFAIEAVGALSSGALQFCIDRKSLNLDRVVALKFLFGIPYGTGGTDDFPEDNIKYIEDLTASLGSKIGDDKYPAISDMDSTLYQVEKSAKLLLSLLQNPPGSVKADDIISSACPSTSSTFPISFKMHKIADGSAGKVEDYNLGGLVEKYLWDCPENLRDRLSQNALPLKRKMPPVEGANRRPRGDNAPAETAAQTVFSRGSGGSAAPSGPVRRDTFRQRKPNTSRPPSMHVDDYVARERNVDSSGNSNVIAVPRVGSSSGRPPSIHVDEFMARQRERQNHPVGIAVGGDVAQVKNTPTSDIDADKGNKSRQLKPDLDDDLQGIDIVFDGEESESDDKLPFPQPDDNLSQPASVALEQNSPHSIVEETESDVNESSQFSHLANVGENTQSEFSSRMSVSRPEIPLHREPSVSSGRKYLEQSDDSKNAPIKTCCGFDSDVVSSSSGYSAAAFGKTSAPSVKLPIDSRIPPHLHSKKGLQQTGNVPLATGSQGLYDQKFQPPLPPMPPPPTISRVPSQPLDPVPSQSSPFMNSMADVQGPSPSVFHVQTDYLSTLSNNSASLLSSSLMPDSKYGRTSISSAGGFSRPPPPLPPTPPPYLSSMTSLKSSTSQSSGYSQTGIGTSELLQTSTAPLNDPRLGNISASGAMLTSYPPPPLMPPLLFSRPTSIPLNIYGSSPTPHQGENTASISQNLPVPLPSIQSIQSIAQLQPLQPPQILRPSQLPQHVRPPIPASPQSEQGVSLMQSPVQMQLQPLQMLQQPQVSPLHVFYQQPQHEGFSHSQQQRQQVEQSQVQILQQEGDGASQQPDSGMSLQDYFSSPEAIQSLLSDRDKLCQLLEQHPKLMQMLQERLGQL